MIRRGADREEVIRIRETDQCLVIRAEVPHPSSRLFDVLILNAGVLLPKEARTKDGHESSFQVNFLAHFLLAEGIIAHQCPERPLKVVTLTSVLAK